MVHRWLIAFFLLLAAIDCFCQSFDESNFTRYTKLDGLSQNYVSSIVQDSIGYIWVATRGGLNRFDGKTFINFFTNSENSPLTDNTVVSLRIHNKNEIIGSTIGGAFSYNTVTTRHKKFIVPADPIFYFWANRVSDAIKDIKGNYVVSTKTGLYVFDHNGKIISRYDHYKQTDAGRIELWFGNWLKPLSNGAVFQQNGLSGSVYYPLQNRIDTFYISKKLDQLGVISPLKGGDTSTSFNGFKDEAIFIDPVKSSIEIISLTANSVSSFLLPQQIINDLNWHSRSFLISDSSIAITSKIGGFYIFNYNANEKKITSSGKKFFAFTYCNSIFKDRDGRLWVGTNDGLYRQNLRNPFFTTDDISLQLPDIVNTGIQSIYSETDDLFVGLRNEGGLLVLDKKTKKIERHINFEKLGKGSNTIIYIFSYHPDTLWLGTNNNVIWLNKKNFTSGNLSHIQGQPAWMKNERCRNYLQDSRGNIWLSFGRLNSVVMFDRSQYNFTEIVSPFLKITFCFSMIEDRQGNVWLAGDGLCRWNVKKGMVDSLIPYAPVRRIQYNFIELLDVDQSNRLWFASGENEVMQYDLAKNRMSLYLQENNILDGFHVANSPVIKNYIWICLSNSISAFHINDYSIKQFNYADGLPNAVATSTRKGSFYDQKENLFYLGAGHYLISFTPDVTLPHTQATPNFFVEIIAGNGKIIPETAGNIRLPSTQNNLQLRFNVINFTDPEDNRHSYRIKGNADSIWHDLNTQSTIGLNNLAAGNYNIEVKLSSVNNRWPEQIKNLNIVIIPVFWKTKWFIVSAVLLLLILLYIFYRLRIRQVRRKADLDKVIAQTEMKALHAQMNPHFIFNCLNSIREMILNNENEQASLYLSKFARLIRITLNQSSKQFVSLTDTVDYLERYIEMEKIRSTHFSNTIEVDEDLQTDEIMVPPMLIQPFIENAIWHGAPHKNSMHINVSFYRNENELICTIEDNGIGVNESLQKKVNTTGENPVGIANIRQRIELLNEKYNLRSTITIDDKSAFSTSNGSGTIVTLHLPLKPKESLWTT